MKYIARLVHIIMPVSIFLAFRYAPIADVHGISGRLLFFHVPLAWSAALAFFVAGMCSIFFLLRNSDSTEATARFSAEIGLMFTLLATISGSVWSKLSWGSYWNWDPRQTSIIILMLIYVAYFSLHSSLRGNEGRAKITSGYLIIAMASLPFLVAIFPRVFGSLHPQSGSLTADLPTKLSLIVALFAFTLLYLQLLSLRRRMHHLEYARYAHDCEKK
jgi:heme exporter protein C